MKKLFLFCLFLLCGANIAFTKPSFATDTLSVQAVVAPVRVIYVNHKNQVQEVIGNTSQNIKPTVICGGKVTVYTTAISHQYQQILADNGGTLKAGQTYFPQINKAITKNPYLKILSEFASIPLLAKELE